MQSSQFGLFEYDQFADLLEGPLVLTYTDNEPRERNVPSRFPYKEVSPFGGVSGYDPLDHAYLVSLRTWGPHKLIESQNVHYHEQPIEPLRSLAFEIVLTEAGHRAMKLANLDSVHWWEGKVDLHATRRSLKQKIEHREIKKTFADALLATNEVWLKEAREALMVEIMKRNIIDDLFVYPPQKVYAQYG